MSDKTMVHADDGLQIIDLNEDDYSLERERDISLPVVLRISYDGEPVSKSRARFTGKGSKTRAYTPERTRAAEERIAWLARSAGARRPRGDVNFGIVAKFTCGNWQRRDVDNMLKLVADALTGVIWVDDEQVSEVSASVERGAETPGTTVVVYQTRANRPPEKPCRVCSKPVRQYNSQPNHYCSRTCSGIAQRQRVTLNCVECGGDYQLPAARAARVKTPFCSTLCRQHGLRVTRACTHCGTSVTRPRSWVKETTFCSVECRRASATHCKHGHEYTPENTYMNQGRKNCRTCRAAAYERRVEKRRADRPGAKPHLELVIEEVRA